MRQVEQDWAATGGAGADTASKAAQYGVVLVEMNPVDGVETERVLPPGTPLVASELRELHRGWARTALQHMRAR